MAAAAPSGAASAPAAAAFRGDRALRLSAALAAVSQEQLQEQRQRELESPWGGKPKPELARQMDKAGADLLRVVLRLFYEPQYWIVVNGLLELSVASLADQEAGDADGKAAASAPLTSWFVLGDRGVRERDLALKVKMSLSQLRQLLSRLRQDGLVSSEMSRETKEEREARKQQGIVAKRTDKQFNRATVWFVDLNQLLRVLKYRYSAMRDSESLSDEHLEKYKCSNPACPRGPDFRYSLHEAVLMAQQEKDKGDLHFRCPSIRCIDPSDGKRFKLVPATDSGRTLDPITLRRMLNDVWARVSHRITVLERLMKEVRRLVSATLSRSGKEEEEEGGISTLEKPSIAPSSFSSSSSSSVARPAAMPLSGSVSAGVPRMASASVSTRRRLGLGARELTPRVEVLPGDHFPPRSSAGRMLSVAAPAQRGAVGVLPWLRTTKLDDEARLQLQHLQKQSEALERRQEQINGVKLSAEEVRQRELQELERQKALKRQRLDMSVWHAARTQDGAGVKQEPDSMEMAASLAAGSEEVDLEVLLDDQQLQSELSRASNGKRDRPSEVGGVCFSVQGEAKPLHQLSEDDFERMTREEYQVYSDWVARHSTYDSF